MESVLSHKQTSMNNKSQSHHFQEVSDIISEEESGKGKNFFSKRRSTAEVAAAVQILSPTIMDSDIVKIQTTNPEEELP